MVDGVHLEYQLMRQSIAGLMTRYKIIRDLLIKRAYQEPSSSDGYRILVDRLWPRGVTKSNIRIDLWLKNIAPSNELRKWFDHDPEKWDEFKNLYINELGRKNEELNIIKQKLERTVTTLVYGAKDEIHNHAVVLQEVIQGIN